LNLLLAYVFSLIASTFGISSLKIGNQLRVLIGRQVQLLVIDSSFCTSAEDAG